MVHFLSISRNQNRAASSKRLPEVYKPLKYQNLKFLAQKLLYTPSHRPIKLSKW